MSEEALQVAEKRREVKGKGEKERYTHLNAQFHRIARRDKKAFLSDQCKEIEENNRIVKTRNLFKKLDLVERVPEELWTEVSNIVQEAVTKIIPWITTLSNSVKL